MSVFRLDLKLGAISFPALTSDFQMLSNFLNFSTDFEKHKLAFGLGGAKQKKPSIDASLATETLHHRHHHHLPHPHWTYFDLQHQTLKIQAIL